MGYETKIIPTQNKRFLRPSRLPIAPVPRVCNQFLLLYADYKGEFMERTIGIEPILPVSKTGALSIGRHAHIKQDTFSFQSYSLNILNLLYVS